MKQIFDENLISIVQKAGLDDSESKVYLTALTLGKASVREIASKSGLNRSSCYAVIERLKSKGLTSLVKRQGKQVVNPVSPNRLFEIQQENTQALQKGLDDLRHLFAVAQKEPGVRFFEGKEGLKTVLAQILSEAKDIVIFGDGDAFKTAMPGWTEFVSEKRLQKKIKVKILLKGTPPAIASAKKLINSSSTKKQYTKIRVLPEAYKIVGGFDVYGDKAVFYSFDEKNVAIVVESRVISTLLKTVFDILWNYAEKYDSTLLR